MDNPPRNAPMPELTQDVLIAVTLVATVAIFGWALRRWRRNGDVVPIYVCIGSLFVAFYEPLGDSLLGAYSGPARVRAEPFEAIELNLAMLWLKT